MDVQCEQCGTEYEFDETLVSDRGTTVKCTECGHLFKVFRAEGAHEASRPWQVRRRDGSVLALTSLRELQKRIGEGEFSERDEISRDGLTWKPLGRIAELETFFATARRMPPSAPSRPRRNTPRGLGAVGPDGPASTMPPPARAFSEDVPTAKAVRPAAADTAASRPPPRRQKTLYGVGLLSEAPSDPPPGAADATAVARPSAIAAADTVVDEALEAGIDIVVSEEPVRGDATAPIGLARPATSTSAPPRALYIDERDAVEAPPRPRSRAGLAIGVVLFLALGAAAAFRWEEIAAQIGLAERPDPLAEFLTRGEAKLAEAHPDAYDAAIREFTRATALDERDPRVLRALARAHAGWAQALAFEAMDLDARAEDDAAMRAQAGERKQAAARHAGEARTFAEDAVRRDPKSYEAYVALADAMRLSGDETGAERQLERAEELRSTRSPEHHLVRALLAGQRANGDMSAARPGAEQAATQDPNFLPARLVLVRALLAQREVGRARQEVDAILSRAPAHPAAVELKRAIERGIPPAHPVVEVGEADASAEEPSPPEAPTPPEPASPALTNAGESTRPTGGFAASPAPSTGGDSIPSGRDYSWYVRKGDEELGRGNVSGAKAYFETALEQRPGASEALNGLGNVALRLGDAAQAVRHFDPATRAGYADAFIGLAEAHRRLGHDADALKAYERYLDRLPSGRHAAVARTQIELLRTKVGKTADPESTRETASEGADRDEKPSPGASNEAADVDAPGAGVEE